MDLQCFDQTNALNGLMGVMMISAGVVLMNVPAVGSSNLGSAVLTFGFLVLALAITDRDLSSLKDARRALSSTRSLIAICSAVSIIAGYLAIHFHTKTLLNEHGDYRVVAELVKNLPAIYNVLIYVGYAGLIVALGLNKNGSVNYVRGGLAALAVAAIYMTDRNLSLAMFGGDPKKVDRAQMLNKASYLLLVAAVAYSC